MQAYSLPGFALLPPLPTVRVTAPRMTVGRPTTSRRTAVRLLAAAALGLPGFLTSNANAEETPEGQNLSENPAFRAMTKKSYVLNGRPPPDFPPPAFSEGRPVFDIAEGLRAQDVKPGTGDEAVSETSLVVARWRVLLDDGSLVDDSNVKTPAFFRPGAHQVPPGIEDAVIGMRPGGARLVSGSAERILTDVALGYDIGERSVVPNNSQLYIEITVDRLDPFGKR